MTIKLPRLNAQETTATTQPETTNPVQRTPSKTTAQKQSGATSEDALQETDVTLSFSDGAKSFLGGMKDEAVNQVKGLIKNAKEHPVETAIAGAAGIAATVGIGALAAMFTPVAIGVGVIGAGVGLYQGAKAVSNMQEAYKNYKSATNEEEAKDALHDMGQGATNTLESAALVAMSAKTAVGGVKGIASEAVYTSNNPKFLSRFLTPNQKSALEVLATTVENDAATYAKCYYASNSLSYAAENAKHIAGIDSAVTTGLESLIGVNKFQNLFNY